MEKHILSKSTFIRGLQCTKSLYLYKNFIQFRDKQSAEQTAIFNRGNNVGLLAQKLFPGGTDATPTKRTDYKGAVMKTQELIASGVEVIYEAAFQHQQVLAILDILVKKDNEWYAYEVKSSTKISHTYHTDAALQYWVITNSGLALADMSLIIINNQYVRNGKLELDKLFVARSVKESALKQQALIDEKTVQLKSVSIALEQPSVAIGEQCFSPYTCDFMGTCWKNVPKNSVFEITGIQKSEQFALYNAGYKTIAEIPETNTLNAGVNAHIDAVKNDKEKIDKVAIHKFLNKANYPLFFMDFESFMPAVPVYDKTKPYQHIPFQYSLHYKKEKDAPLEHFYFLAEQGSDPRKSFLENLLKDTELPGSILVYDTLMERNILNGLKHDFPEFASAIDSRLHRIIDLMVPFQDKSYYHPAMKNSFSIKNLLHALVPDLSYTSLAIASGSVAMTAFEGLQTETDLFRIIEVREQLHEYCKLDTLSMVKIFEKLEEVVK